MTPRPDGDRKMDALIRQDYGGMTASYLVKIEIVVMYTVNFLIFP